MVDEPDVDKRRRSPHRHFVEQSVLQLPLDAASQSDANSQALLDRPLNAVGPIQLHEHRDLAQTLLCQQLVDQTTIAGPARRQDERLLLEIFDAHALPVRKPMAGATDEDYRFSAQRLDFQVRRNLASDDDPAVDGAVDDLPADLRTLTQTDHDLGARVLALEPAEDRWEDMAPDGHAGANHDAPRLRVFEVVDPLARQGFRAQHVEGPLVYNLACLCWHGAPIATFEELDAKMPLDR